MTPDTFATTLVGRAETTHRAQEQLREEIRTFGSTYSSEDLLRLVLWLADGEGRQRVYGSVETAQRRAERIRSGSVAPKAVLHVALEYVLQGPDDDWSGERRVVERARYRGVLQATKDVQECIELIEATS
jgi:hypothetical protein